jgi:predicted secreted Zn-dependent protease
VHRLPKWANYDKASKEAKAEWDRMVAKLKIHEDRHLAIAIEEANQLAADLIGHDIGDISDMVTEANRRMAQRQQDMDDASEHGAKEGVPYGDVVLDITIK